MALSRSTHLCSRGRSSNLAVVSFLQSPQVDGHGTGRCFLFLVYTLLWSAYEGCYVASTPRLLRPKVLLGVLVASFTLKQIPIIGFSSL